MGMCKMKTIVEPYRTYRIVDDNTGEVLEELDKTMGYAIVDDNTGEVTGIDYTEQMLGWKSKGYNNLIIELIRKR